MLNKTFLKPIYRGYLFTVKHLGNNKFVLRNFKLTMIQNNCPTNYEYIERWRYLKL